MGHRVAPDPLVDRLALEHLALGLGEQLQQLELAAGQVEAARRRRRPGTVGADLELADDERAGFGLAARRGGDGATTASIRAIASSGWQGLVIQSSTPRRRAAHPLGHGRAPGADDHAEIGEHPADPLRGSPSASSPSTAGSSSSAFSFIATSSSGGMRAGDLALLPAGRFGALGQHRDETAVVVDYREPDGLLRRTTASDCMQPRDGAIPETLRSQDFHRPIAQFAGKRRFSGIFPGARPAASVPFSRDSSLVPRTAPCPGPFAFPAVAQLIAPVAASASTRMPRAIR